MVIQHKAKDCNNNIQLHVKLENKASMYWDLKCPDIQLYRGVLFSHREHLNSEFWKPELSDEVIESVVPVNRFVKFYSYMVVIWCSDPYSV